MASVCLLAVAGCGPGNEYDPPPAPPVTVAKPLVQTVHEYLEETGSTEAVELVEIRARVRGFIEKIDFKPGQEVRGQSGFYDAELESAAATNEAKSATESGASGPGPTPTEQPTGEKNSEGDKPNVLFVIEKQLYEAEVAQAQAEVNNAQADFHQADIDYRRAIPLTQQGVITEEELGQRKAKMEIAKAKVQLAAAALKEADINLAYCDVVSPIDGRVGKPLVKLGNLVDGNEGTHLVSVIRYDPIYVNFSISETTWQEIRKRAGAEGDKQLARSEYPTVKMFASRQIDGDEYPFQGHLDYVSLEVEESTGTLPIRGIFPNADTRLYPGMYVKVRVPMEPLTDALLVPEASIGTDQAGRYVLVVGKENKVERRDVKVGPSFGGMQVVGEGLTPSDLVIVDGIQRARKGAVVDPKETKLPPLENDGAQTLRSQPEVHLPENPPAVDESVEALFPDE